MHIAFNSGNKGFSGFTETFVSWGEDDYLDIFCCTEVDSPPSCLSSLVGVRASPVPVAAAEAPVIAQCGIASVTRRRLK